MFLGFNKDLMYRVKRYEDLLTMSVLSEKMVRIFQKMLISDRTKGFATSYYLTRTGNAVNSF